MTQNHTQRNWVLGGTGLVGQSLLKQLADDAGGGQTLVWTRRALAQTWPGHIQTCLVDMQQVTTWPAQAVDTVYCCLGTTIRTAGSQAAFSAVDLDLVIALARHAKAQGCTHFLVVSAMGANPASLTFYNRVKGQMEAALQNLGFARLSIVRPSLLAGDRSEHRPGEAMGLVLANWFKPLIPARYRAVSVDAVARCLLETSRQAGAGVKIIESDLIQTYNRP